MKNTNQAGKSSDVEQGRSTPWPFFLILAVVIVPIVAAYVAYYTGMGVSDETVNKGTLLEPPVSLEQLTQSAEGGLPDLTERKWRILLPVTSPCRAACQENLYTTRQVHIRLGEKGLRVERVAANLDGVEGSAELETLQAEHPRLKQFSVPHAAWNEWLAGTNVPGELQAPDYYLLVDQTGYAMMFYTSEHHGNELLDDIKRVLRYTPE